MTRPFRAAACVAGALAVVGAAGCGGRSEDEGREGPEADTAEFSYGGRTATVPLTACGREGDVVVLGGSTGSIVLQAEADLGEGGFDRTGVTADLRDDGIVGAFGADMDDGPAGEITEVRVDGDRLIVEGSWVTFDDQLQVQAGTPEGGIEGRLEARCPETAADDPDT